MTKREERAAPALYAKALRRPPLPKSSAGNVRGFPLVTNDSFVKPNASIGWKWAVRPVSAGLGSTNAGRGMRQLDTVVHFFLIAACATLVTGVSAQTSPPEQTEHPATTASPVATPGQTEHAGTVLGTVVSVTRQTMVVRTDDNQFNLFVLESDLVRPKGLTAGTRIRVASESTGESGVRLATRITILEPVSAPPPGPPPDVAPPPKELLSTQREIERLARRWQLGARIGAGLDPELFLIGVHTAIGPIFTNELYFRPNVEFAFGELTDMFAINLEAAYRLPITFRQGRWSAYVGAGPGLNFIHKGVATREISFSDFTYETGLNFFGGVRFRRGTFAEVKTNLWARGVPTLRLIFGYTF
jgi:hypothetical protein